MDCLGRCHTDCGLSCRNHACFSSRTARAVLKLSSASTSGSSVEAGHVVPLLHGLAGFRAQEPAGMEQRADTEEKHAL
eukprot:56916-Rhodomonas_salina.3